MEVHHHAHHEHGKRNWKSYFWEFLMLFLAVFCGMLAEYQLEHKIERDREIQFMVSLKQDLSSDIKQIDSLTREMNTSLEKLDRLAAGLLEGVNKEVSFSTIKLIFSSIGFNDFVYTDKTISQLKNSGGMRLIRNQQVADKIAAYDALVRRSLVNQNALNESVLPGLTLKLRTLTNFAMLEKSNYPNLEAADTLMIQKNAFLINDRNEYIQLANEIRYYKNRLRSLVRFLGRDKEGALKLIDLLNKEYHLDE